MFRLVSLMTGATTRGFLKVFFDNLDKKRKFVSRFRPGKNDAPTSTPRLPGCPRPRVGSTAPDFTAPTGPR